jgi:CheY-like chemotaxis protein
MDRTTQPPAILIVDDDPPTLLLLKYALRKLAPAYDVLTAEHAQSALRHLAERPIPLLITDYLLPDMDGLRLTAAVKAESPQTYVIVTSADDSTEVKQRAYEQSVDLFLSKMDLLDHLGDVLHSVLPPAAVQE